MYLEYRPGRRGQCITPAGCARAYCICAVLWAPPHPIQALSRKFYKTTKYDCISLYNHHS